MLRKGVYPYEYMDNWERFNETSLPSKKSFYSSLNMENIEDIDYRHGNNVFNKFKLNNLGEYHDLYVQSDTLLLADVFESFRDMCLKEYEKKTNVELELLTDYDMLLMVEEGIRGGICHSIHRYAKANNKYMKNYNKDEESSYIQDLDANNLYGWAMSKKLPVNGFKWLDSDKINEINEDFIKIMMKIMIKVIFLKWMLNIQRDLCNYIVIYRSYQNEWKKSVKNSFVIYSIRKNTSHR